MFAGCALALAAPAHAEVAFSGTLASDDRFRGDTTSGERPVATFSIAYDDIHGPYAGVSFTAVFGRGGPVEPLRTIQYAGYAKRLNSSISIDVGLSHRISSHYYTGEYARQLTEAYVGIVGRNVSTHVFYSPDYDGHGGDAVYTEVEGLLLDRGSWSLNGHVGVLVPPREPLEKRRMVGDARLATTHRFGRTAFSLSLVAASPAQESGRWRRTIVASLTHSF